MSGDLPPHLLSPQTLLLDVLDQVGKIKGQTELLLQDRAAAAADRQAVMEKMDENSTRVGMMELAFARLETPLAELAKIGPVVWRHEKTLIQTEASRSAGQQIKQRAVTHWHLMMTAIATVAGTLMAVMALLKFWK